MMVSATHEASAAPTAASAAEPPSRRISSPASAVAGWPAATPARILGLEITSGSLGTRNNGSHKGRQARDRRPARPQGGRHGLRAGSDRVALAADRGPYRAPPDTREGPPFPPRAAQAGRAPPATLGLPAKEGPGGVSHPHQGPGPAQVENATRPGGAGGSLRERRFEAASNLRLRLPKERGGIYMSTTMVQEQA